MSTPDQIHEQIEQTQQELRDDVDAMRDKLNPMNAAQRGAERIGDAATRARETVMGKAEEGADRAQTAAQDAKEKAQGTVRGNPLAVGLLAFALGWLASSLIPASRPEKKAAATLRESGAVQSAAQPLADSARSVAEQASEEVRGAARAVGEDAKAGVESVKATLGTGEESTEDAPLGSTAALQGGR